MPAGKTHDRITLYLAPLVIGINFGVTRSERLSLLMAIAFVFSGLMFGPDLDIHSCQYKRWGWLRWVWLPYRAMVRHRSPLSHGFLIGTILRLVYVACWALVIGLAIAAVGSLLQQENLLLANWQIWQAWIYRHRWELATIFLGLELGAMSHSLSDWGGSWLKKQPWFGSSAPRKKSARR
jgi:uncharacterized metal-binding protein